MTTSSTGGPIATAAPPPQGPTTTAPDLPPVPRATMSRFAKVVLGGCGLMIASYAYGAATGWEPAQPQRDEVPASVRASTGGYRSFHFWHSGYQGGK